MTTEQLYAATLYEIAALLRSILVPTPHWTEQVKAELIAEAVDGKIIIDERK